MTEDKLFFGSFITGGVIAIVLILLVSIGENVELTENITDFAGKLKKEIEK